MRGHWLPLSNTNEAKANNKPVPAVPVRIIILSF